VSSDGRRLLAGYYDERQLHIYNITDTDSTYVRSLQLPGGKALFEDAVWAPYNGSIVCSTNDARWPVLVMSVFGDVIANVVNEQGLMKRGGCFSVASDNIIYYASSVFIFQSKDNGVTWKRVITLQKTFYARQLQAITVASNKSDSNDILVIKSNGNGHWRMCVYTTTNRYDTGGCLTWCDITLPPSIREKETKIRVEDVRLAFDGHTYIYVPDSYNKSVHVWSVDGQYHGHLLTTHLCIETLALDTQRHVMYVGQKKGVVSVFSLQYNR
jgi:hypothetical protein